MKEKKAIEKKRGFVLWSSKVVHSHSQEKKMNHSIL